MNILYLGMGIDILTPLLLCPEFTNLYVMDVYDVAYTYETTIDGQYPKERNINVQRSSIIDILTKGKQNEWKNDSKNRPKIQTKKLSYIESLFEKRALSL